MPSSKSPNHSMTIPRYPTAKTRAGQYRQVYEGRAMMTKGGLRKSQLCPNKSGKIVSCAQQKNGRKRYIENGLHKYTWNKK